MSFQIPTQFEVETNIKQAEPLKVELRIGPRVLFVAAASLLTVLFWKKVK